MDSFSFFVANIRFCLPVKSPGWLEIVEIRQRAVKWPHFGHQTGWGRFVAIHDFLCLVSHLTGKWRCLGESVSQYASCWKRAKGNRFYGPVGNCLSAFFFMPDTVHREYGILALR